MHIEIRREARKMKIKNTCPKCGRVQIEEQKFEVRCFECGGVEMKRESLPNNIGFVEEKKQ